MREIRRKSETGVEFTRPRPPISLTKGDLKEPSIPELPDHLHDPAAIGLEAFELGLPDPRSPLGISKKFEQAVSVDAGKSNDQMLEDLLYARDFVRDSKNLPEELSNVASLIIDDEIRKVKLAISRTESLLEL